MDNRSAPPRSGHRQAGNDLALACSRVQHKVAMATSTRIWRTLMKTGIKQFAGVVLLLARRNTGVET